MAIYDNINIDDAMKVMKRVEDDSEQIDSIVNGIIKPYCADLDEYVKYINSRLAHGERKPTSEELDSFCLNLSALIYSASEISERLGIREDISKAILKETYHNTRNSIDGGTVADKNSIAELSSQQEQLINICYSRAYKIMKDKVEDAKDLVGSVKKVMSRRMSEAELTRITN